MVDKGLICVGCVLRGVVQESSKEVMLRCWRRCSVWRLEVHVRMQSGRLTKSRLQVYGGVATLALPWRGFGKSGMTGSHFHFCLSF